MSVNSEHDRLNKLYLAEPESLIMEAEKGENMQIDGILFDFDGTLFDTISLIVESYQYTYRKHNKREHTAEEIKAGIGLPLETIFNNEYPEDGADLLKTYLEHNNNHTATGYGIFLGIGPMLTVCAN